MSDAAVGLAMGITAVTTIFTLCGIAYLLLALAGARQFVHQLRRKKPAAFTPAVSLLKPLKGVDPEMMIAFRSRCPREYAGEYEILFGVSSMADPAVEHVRALQQEFPAHGVFPSGGVSGTAGRERQGEQPGTDAAAGGARLCDCE